MDKRLFNRLAKIEQHIDALKQVEGEFLYLEAHKKVMFSSLFISAEGKSVAEREAAAYSSKEWVDFADGHASKEAEYNYMRRLYELKLKAYDAEHLTLKTEAPAIGRQGATT
jgi:hypothetical protein